MTSAQWRDLIAQQASSSESVVAFCRRLGLTPKSFYRRRAALRQAESSKGLVVVKPPVSHSASGPMVVSWRGIELTVSESTSPTWIAQLMRELADAPVA
ncbi:MAG: IS66 family insertion sequence element accessory protein TnpA [Candidatus Wenzhouxiangella sp. M2_3B_020]